MPHHRSFSAVIILASMGVLAACNTPEEKAIARERIDLVKQEASLVDQNPGCAGLQTALDGFERTNAVRISTFNAKWTALPESKRNSLMKPLRSESNPYFKTLIGPLIKCDAFPGEVTRTRGNAECSLSRVTT